MEIIPHLCHYSFKSESSKNKWVWIEIELNLLDINIEDSDVRTIGLLHR